MLPEPNEWIFVIRPMVRLADASFRRGYGSVIIQGAKRVYRRSLAQEKGGVILLVSSVVLSNHFYAKGRLAERSQPGCGQTRQRHYKVLDTLSCSLEPTGMCDTIYRCCLLFEARRSNSNHHLLSIGPKLAFRWPRTTTTG